MAYEPWQHGLFVPEAAAQGSIDVQEFYVSTLLEFPPQISAKRDCELQVSGGRQNRQNIPYVSKASTRAGSKGVDEKTHHLFGTTASAGCRSAEDEEQSKSRSPCASL